MTYLNQLPSDFELPEMDWETPPPSYFVWEITSDEQLTEMRRDWRGTAYGWKRYIEQEFPNKDPKEEFKLMRELMKPREIARCGKVWITVKKLKDGTVGHKLFECGHNDCPTCAQKREDENLERIQRIPNATFTTIKPEGKENYWRVQYNNEIVWIVENGDGKYINYDMARDIAKQNRLKKSDFRPSGKLGQKSETAQETEGKAKIKRRPALILAPKETAKKIEQEATEESWPEKSPETEEELQKAISDFEDALKRIGRKYDDCEAIHYLRIETIYINMKEVNWGKPPN